MTLSEQIRAALEDHLGRRVVHLERCYHTRDRQFGTLVYSWTVQFDDNLTRYGCYETMRETVDALRAGGRFVVRQDVGPDCAWCVEVQRKGESEHGVLRRQKPAS